MAPPKTIAEEVRVPATPSRAESPPDWFYFKQILRHLGWGGEENRYLASPYRRVIADHGAYPPGSRGDLPHGEGVDCCRIAWRDRLAVQALECGRLNCSRDLDQLAAAEGGTVWYDFV